MNKVHEQPELFLIILLKKINIGNLVTGKYYIRLLAFSDKVVINLSLESSPSVPSCIRNSKSKASRQPSDIVECSCRRRETRCWMPSVHTWKPILVLLWSLILPSIATYQILHHIVHSCLKIFQSIITEKKHIRNHIYNSDYWFRTDTKVKKIKIFTQA